MSASGAGPAPAKAAPSKAVRACDGCTLCCKLMGVREIAKPRGVWCPHCTVGVGCTIYEDRPMGCRTFECGYLLDAGLPEAWKPSVSRLVISSEVVANRLNIHVDPARPDAWRRQPYYAEIKQWARRIVAIRGQVIVNVGERTIVILPDHDVDLGVVTDDELIVVSESAGPGGRMGYEAYAVSRASEAGREIDAVKGSAVAIRPDAASFYRRGRTLA